MTLSLVWLALQLGLWCCVTLMFLLPFWMFKLHYPAPHLTSLSFYQLSAPFQYLCLTIFCLEISGLQAWLETVVTFLVKVKTLLMTISVPLLVLSILVVFWHLLVWMGGSAWISQMVRFEAVVPWAWLWRKGRFWVLILCPGVVVRVVLKARQKAHPLFKAGTSWPSHSAPWVW